MHSPARVTTDASQRRDRRGQVIVIFAGAMLLFVLLAATVIDLSWFWTNNLRMQRAADASALAGVIFLPANEPRAILVANEEAEKNGYVDGVNGITITAAKDATNDRVLLVSIEGPVNTYFARAVGITSWTAKRDSKAEYVLPVPMGSPQNYFGVGFFRDAEDTTTANTPIVNNTDTGQRIPTTAPSGTWAFTPTGGGRTVTSVVQSENDQYATATTNLQAQQWGSFGVSIPAPGTNETVSIRGIEVRLTDAFLNGTCANSQVRASLSWDGTTFQTQVATPNLGTTSTTDYTLPATNGSTSTAAWGTHTWLRTDFSDSLFRVRLDFVKGCTTPAGRLVNLDMVQVRVYYRITTQTYTTTTDVVDRSVISPYGQVLAPQNFWGAMQSQGAPNLQGDAYMTKYDTRTGKVANSNNGTDPDAEYDYTDYYGYAIEMPAGSTGGEVWIFDAGFCDASTASGTGENWTVNGSNSGGIQPSSVSAFYTLKDAGTNLFDPGDDGTVYSVSSGNTFRQMAYTDRAVITELQSTGELNDSDYDNDRTVGADCANASWHYDVNSWDDAPTLPRRGWYLLGAGLTGGADGTTYRLHTYSTDLGSLGNQDNSTGLNAFAFYARAAGSAVPRVYGIGAMEAYVRLPGGRASEFYLAQIEATHAGKTMVINLWDPGDTGALSADLEILAPGTNVYTPVNFKHWGTLGTTDAGASNGGGSRKDCEDYSSSSTNKVRTSDGGTNGSHYNGCWLTIEIEIPPTYTAPHPTSDAVTTEGGWWKIRYGMGGNSTDFSTDLTTWQVDIRGNPVHLVLP